jgi:hypothetical protein
VVLAAVGGSDGQQVSTRCADDQDEAEPEEGRGQELDDDQDDRQERSEEGEEQDEDEQDDTGARPAADPGGIRPEPARPPASSGSGSGSGSGEVLGS